MLCFHDMLKSLSPAFNTIAGIYLENSESVNGSLKKKFNCKNNKDSSLFIVFIKMDSSQKYLP